jgi:hypothetical protein
MSTFAPQDLVDLDAYPIVALHEKRGAKLVAQCRESLRATALCALPGFIRPDAIAQMISESLPLADSAPYYNEPRTSYGYNPEALAQWPSDHPRRAHHENRYRQVLNDQIGHDAALRALYQWPSLTEFVRQVFGAETMYRSHCPDLSLCLKVACRGDTDGWHYDPNDGVVSLLLQAPDEGGQFEYAPYIRTDDDECYDAIAELFANPNAVATRPGVTPGTFVFFNGHLSMHRVTPVGETQVPRVAALLSFDRKPDQEFSPRYIEHLRSFPSTRMTLR